jgi:hypothetical protein
MGYLPIALRTQTNHSHTKAVVGEQTRDVGHPTVAEDNFAQAANAQDKLNAPTLANLDAHGIKDTEDTTNADGITNKEDSVVKERHEVQGNAGHLDTTTEKEVVQESGCTEDTTNVDGITNKEDSVVKQRHEVQGNAGHLDTTTEKAVVQESVDLHVQDKWEVPNPDGKKRLHNKSIYKKYQKLLEKSNFPCPKCGHAADGSHQCVNSR